MALLTMSVSLCVYLYGSFDYVCVSVCLIMGNWVSVVLCRLQDKELLSQRARFGIDDVCGDVVQWPPYRGKVGREAQQE